MRFTPKEEIRAKGRIFEEGSQLDSEKQDIDADTLERWYTSGWIDIEGRDPSPPRQPGAVTVRPDSAKHSQQETKHG